MHKNQYITCGKTFASPTQNNIKQILLWKTTQAQNKLSAQYTRNIKSSNEFYEIMANYYHTRFAMICVQITQK
jgi:hypothetical protein